MIYHGTITMENGAELPFELYPEDAPRTVENFVKLVKEGYYDGKTFTVSLKTLYRRAAAHMEPVPGIWAIRFPVKRQTTRISMRMEACLWHIAVRIPAVVSFLSATVRSRIWMGYIPYSAR